MRGFRLGRIFGLEIAIDFSWLLILVLVVWSFSSALFPSVAPELSSRDHFLMGLVGTALFFGSLLLHEIAHSLMARAKGIEVESITLFIFGGVSRMREEAKTPEDEFLIAGIGPAASVTIAAFFWLVHAVGAAMGWGVAILVVARYLGYLNLLLAGFNLLPGFPLDGGRLFRAAVWWWRDDLDTATRWASRGGQLLGMLLAAFGVLQLFGGNLLGGLWMGFIGWFLASAAKMSYRQHLLGAGLEGVTARDAMTADPRVVPPSLTVAELAEERFLRDKHGAYPVVEGGRPIGLVTLDETGQVPRERWEEVRVRDVMIPLDDDVRVGPGDELFEIIGKIATSSARRVLVVDEEGRLAGILSPRDVTAWIAVKGGRVASSPPSLAGRNE
ncbi:MAG: site-2 protease family protein [Gemmatimonadota bacterium]